MTENLTFKEAIQLTHAILDRFAKIEKRPWGIDGSMIELSKQVGDLAAQVMSFENYYFQDREKLNPKYLATKETIADELADILYVLIAIARHYDINLADAHIKARQNEDKFLKTRGV